MSVKEKSPGVKPRWQVGVEEMNESEPSLKRRDTQNGVKTRIFSSSWDELKGYLVTDLSGSRRKDGMTSTQALVRNLGTSRSNAKRKIQEGDTSRMKVSMSSTGADWFVVAMKSVKADGAKGPTYLWSYDLANRKGGANE